jgi:hypothetical protein
MFRLIYRLIDPKIVAMNLALFPMQYVGLSSGRIAIPDH